MASELGWSGWLDYYQNNTQLVGQKEINSGILMGFVNWSVYV